MFHKTRQKFTVLFAALAATCLLVVPGCGDDSSSDTTEALSTTTVALATTTTVTPTTTVAPEPVEKPLIVVTTNILGDVVGKAVGDLFDVETIMPPGADPHVFQASAKQVDRMMKADLLVVNGANFEEGLLDVIKGAESDGVKVFEAIDSVDPLEDNDKEEGHDDHDEEGHDDHDEEGHDDHDEEGHDDHDGHEGHGHGAYDPHFWFDPNRVAYAAEFIESKLVEFDSSNAANYEAAGDAYTKELSGLTGQVSQLIGSIPSQNRKLITTHESLGYLEAKFGLEVLSTIIPDLDSSNEITPSQLVGVIDVIEDNNVKVIFIEAEAPSVYAETIVAETGIKAVEGLWVETLKPGQTYPEFLIAAVELIVENLSNTD